MTNLHLAFKMLRNMGENISSFLRNVAFNTGRRGLRRRLVCHLEHTCGLSPQDLATIKFVVVRISYVYVISLLFVKKIFIEIQDA